MSVFFTSISHSLASLWPDQQHQCIFAFSLNRRTVQKYVCFYTTFFFVRSVLHFIYIFMTKITTKIPTKLPIFEIFSMYVLLLCVVFFKLLVFSFQCVHKMLFTLCKRFDSINALFFLPFRIIPIRRSARCSFFLSVPCMFCLYIAINVAFEYAII